MSLQVFIKSNYFFVSLCGVRLRQKAQNFFNSRRSGFCFLSLVLL